MSKIETYRPGQEQEDSFEKERIASNFSVLLEERNRVRRESYESIYGKGTGEFIDLDKRDIEYLQEIMTSPEVSSRQLTEEEKKIADQMLGEGIGWLPFPDFEKKDASYDTFFSANQVAFIPRETINDFINNSDDPRYRVDNPINYYELIENLGIKSAWVPNVRISEGKARDLALELHDKLFPSVDQLRSEGDE